MGVAITFRRPGRADLDLLLSVRDGLFDNPIDLAQAQAFLEDPLHELILAFEGDEAVGMATGTVLFHPDKQPSMFINEVGVREGWMRRGIGRAVTERLIEVARARGCKGVWVGTETDNVAARGLYLSLGGEEFPFVGYGWDDAF